MRVARIGDLRVHWQEDGDPAGVPMVFANPLGADLRIWDALLPLLPGGLRFIRYDMRGHGLSDAPDGDYYMADLVSDAAGLIDHLGLSGAIFVGLSIGGVVAQGLAAERPDLLRAVVLSNTAPKIGTEASWRDRIGLVRAGGIASIADGVLEKWFPRRFHRDHPDDLAMWRNMLMRSPLDGYVGCCAALADTDLRESTAGLRLPVLAVAGSLDGSTPADLVREMAASIAGSRFELIGNTGHVPCVDAAGMLAQIIAEFLRSRGLLDG